MIELHNRLNSTNLIKNARDFHYSKSYHDVMYLDLVTREFTEMEITMSYFSSSIY